MILLSLELLELPRGLQDRFLLSLHLLLARMLLPRLHLLPSRLPLIDTVDQTIVVPSRQLLANNLLPKYLQLQLLQCQM